MNNLAVVSASLLLGGAIAALPLYMRLRKLKQLSKLPGQIEHTKLQQLKRFIVLFIDSKGGHNYLYDGNNPLIAKNSWHTMSYNMKVKKVKGTLEYIEDGVVRDRKSNL